MLCQSFENSENTTKINNQSSIALRTNATFEITNMMVELNGDIKGIAFTPSVVTLKNNPSLVTDTSHSPVTIQADKVLFSLDPILNIKEPCNVQYQSTTCSKTKKEKI